MIIPAGPLSRMTLPDLLQEATIRGLQIPANATRPILTDLIEKYQQPAAPGNPPPPQVQNQTLAQNQAPPAGNHAPAAPQVAYDPNIANLMELLAKAAADVPPSLTPACCWLTPLRCPAGHYDLWDFLQSFHIRAPTYTPELRTHFTLTTQLHDEMHIHFITHRTLGIVAGTPPI